MFESIYSEQLSQYYKLRTSVLSESAQKHELCYLRRFDCFIKEHNVLHDQLTEKFMDNWVASLSGIAVQSRMKLSL